MLMRSQPALRLGRPALSGPWSRPAPVPVDVVRAVDETVFTIDVPGVDPDAIDPDAIDITPDVLAVRAERRPFQIGVDDRLWVSERRSGAFARRLVLDEPADVDRASAGYDAGVLTIRVPGARRSRRCRVMVTTTAAAGCATSPTDRVSRRATGNASTGDRAEDGAA